MVKSQKSQLPNRVRRCRSDAGFTLVELMITISIVGILLAVGSAIIRNPRNERAMVGASSGFSQLSQRARNRAMSTGNAVIMRVQSHRPTTDVITGQMVGNGSGNTRIEIYELAGADCDSLRPSAPLIDPVILDPLSPTSPYRHGVISRLAPGGASSNRVEMCYLPTGRMVDAATGREFANIGGSPFGGRALYEFRAVNCQETLCRLVPGSRTVAVNANGLAEVMPKNFDLGEI